MPPIINQIDEKDKIVTLPVFIDGYGVIKDHNDWRLFCRRFAQLRSAYNQLVHITNEVQGVDHETELRL